MNRFSIASLVVVVASGAGLLLWRQGFQATAFARPSVAPAVSAQLASLREDVAQLRQRSPISGPVIVKYESERAAESASAEPSPTPAPELTPEQKAERAEQHAQAMAAALDQRLASEARDPAWSNESLASIGASISARVAGATLLESVCSATVCRATLAHESEAEQQTLGNAIAESPPFNQGTLYRYDRTSKPPKTTLYVIRSGHDLAELTGLGATDLDGQ